MASLFKVSVLNVGQHVKAVQFQDFLRRNMIADAAVEKRPWSFSAVVTFPSEAARASAVARLTTLQWHGKALAVKVSGDESSEAVVAGPAVDAKAADAAATSGGQEAQEQSTLKRRRTASDDEAAGDLGNGPAAVARDVNDVVTPWRDVPYPAQLSRKAELMGDVLRAFAMKSRAHVLRKMGIKWLDRHAKKAMKLLADHEAAKPGSAAAALSRAADGAGSPEPAQDAAPAAAGDVTEAPAGGAGDVVAPPPASAGDLPKEEFLRRCRSDITRNLPPDAVANIPAWLVSAAAAHDGQACPVYPIVSSPDVTGYRNKASFTIGLDADGKPCVGSRVSSFSEGCTVARPDGAVHLPAAILAIAAVLNSFVVASPLRPYDLITHRGLWRAVTVRWSPSRQEAMVIVLLQPTGAPDAASASAVGCPGDAVSDAPPAPLASPRWPSDPMAAFPEPVASELIRLDALLAAPELRVVSYFAQSYDGLSQPPPNHPHVLLSGRATITEELCGMRFLVSPGAFFQVNSGAAELLYSLVRDLAVHGAAGLPAGGPLAQVKKKTVDEDLAESAEARSLAVLDVCCGTGTIGIICSPLADRVVGVELSEDAIADAVANARLNSVANASFVCSRAEDVMPRLLSLASRVPGESASSLGRDGAAAVSVVASSDSLAAIAGEHVPATLAVMQEASPAVASGLAGPDGGAVTPLPLAPSAQLSVPPLSALAVASDSPADAMANPSAGIKSVVAILDPPRGGVHMDVIRALRTCKLIKRIVYVSCNPTGSFVEDAVRFCAPQEDRSGFARGPAFRAVASVPVDLFPHTHHTELVTLFERD